MGSVYRGDKLKIFKASLLVLKIDSKFHIKYQSATPKKIHKSKSW